MINLLPLLSFFIQLLFNIAFFSFILSIPNNRKQPCCLIILLLFNCGFTHITFSRSLWFIKDLKLGLSLRISCNSLDISGVLLNACIYEISSISFNLFWYTSSTKSSLVPRSASWISRSNFSINSSSYGKSSSDLKCFSISFFKSRQSLVKLKFLFILYRKLAFSHKTFAFKVIIWVFVEKLCFLKDYADNTETVSLSKYFIYSFGISNIIISPSYLSLFFTEK